MKPGRELDALVAEKVMGLQVELRKFPYPPDDYSEDFATPPLMSDGTAMLATRNGRPIPWEPVPNYSTSIADAWDVVELLQQHGIIRISNGDGDSYDCDFMPFDGGAFGKYQFANAGGSEQPTESWPHAICLTALKAVKEERETK